MLALVINNVRFVGLILFVLLIPSAFGVNEGWSWRESFDSEIEGKVKTKVDDIHTDLARWEVSLFKVLKERETYHSRLY